MICNQQLSQFLFLVEKSRIITEKNKQEVSFVGLIIMNYNVVKKRAARAQTVTFADDLTASDLAMNSELMALLV